MEKKFVPCQESCPTRTDIPTYIRLMMKGKFYEAWKVNRVANVFPAICGRICTHPCELACKRTCIKHEVSYEGEADPVSLEPVSIRELKRTITDNIPDDYQERFLQEILPTIKNNGKKIAIIGSGPAGLTIANNLRLAGFEVTIFEAEKEAGGMLRLGIPEFRLPKEILDEEIELLEKLGIKFQFNTLIGKNISFDSIKQEYDATVLAIGAHKPLKLNVAGEDLDGVYPGIVFLKSTNTSFPSPLNNKKVTVIGGGFTASDCAKTALRLGASEVSVLYRRAAEDLPMGHQEYQEMLTEGINFEFLVSPKFISEENKKVSGITLAKNKIIGKDQNGKNKIQEINDSEFSFETDAIIIAIDQGSDFSLLAEELGILPEKFKELPKIFLVGDCATGKTRNVIGVIAEAHQVAEKIKKQFGIHEEEKVKTDLMETTKSPWICPETDIEKIKRNEPKIKKGLGFSEKNQGLSPKNAIRESKRCFQCNVAVTTGNDCIGCQRCIDVCPQDAVSLIKTAGTTPEEHDFFINGEYFHEDGYKIVIDYKKCTNCGICVEQCPYENIKFVGQKQPEITKKNLQKLEEEIKKLTGI